jgi:hypothetical protein
VRRYGSEDNQRWLGFEHRPGDIVISTRSKSGTTWLQMMCALLVFQTADLPAPLAELSPWLDWSVEPAGVVQRRLAGQQHRRIIKTHTPLDGLPLDPRVTYLVVGRHPLDVAVSLYHHGRNIDRRRVSELNGRPVATGPTAPLLDWMGTWIDPAVGAEAQLDHLPGLLHHLGDAWARQHEPNVVLIHYQDLADDTERQMRALADRLAIDVAEDRWPDLVHAASFEAMKQQAAWLAPDRLGVLKDPDVFFRSGHSGEGRALLHSAGGNDHYDQRIRELAPPDLISWLHR